MTLRQIVPVYIFIPVLLLLASFRVSSAQEVVLYASQAPVKVGNWSAVSDSTAAGGARLANPDAGAAKLATAFADPSSYAEVTFTASAGKPYRIWIRGKAQSDSYYNDSIFVQFSGSVNSSGGAVYRIGTTSSIEINLEDCLNCGVQGWGWQDNGWGGLGPQIFFQSSGTQTLRIQAREDGLSIDQIVISPSTYLFNSPGALKNDTVILPASSGSAPAPTPTPTPTPTPAPTPTPTPTPTTSSPDVVIWAANVPSTGIRGNWFKEGIGSAAGQIALRNPDRGGAKLSTALASPVDYFDITFNAEAGKPYRLWVRGRADGDYWGNDSVFAQFSGSLNVVGTPAYRIGTTDAVSINLEDCSGCGIQNWGWQDDGWGVNLLGPVVYFQTTGPQTLRIQTREDGFTIDQIVLSSYAYLYSSPGSNKNDTTILESNVGQPPPPSQESPNNTRVPPATQIVDSTLAVWTRTSNGAILRNSAGTGGIGSQILYCNRIVYVLGTDSQWWRWISGWIPVGGTDPCGPAPTPTPTPTPTNKPPQVSISATPTSGNSPLFVNFASAASDPDGYIQSYSWTFGDGNSSTVPNPTNTYSSPGIYTARLMVTDNQGGASSATVQINVSSPPPPPSSTGTLRVLSYNMSFGKGTDNIQNWDRMAQWITQINPDIAGLCEMPSEWISTFVSLVNQRTGRTWYTHFIPKYNGTTEGNLILSKYSFSSTGGQFLSGNRSVAQVTINVAGRTVNFFATHLDPDSSGTRYAQAGELMSYASNFSESRIVVGDFNAGPDTSESVSMTGAYYDSWMQAMAGGTAVAYPDNPVYMQTRTRRGRIDYVWYSKGSGNLFLRGTQIPDTRDLNNTNVVVYLGTTDDKGVRPSDHNPMIANFDIR